MTTKVISVAPTLPLYDLICLLVDQNVNGVPVVDEQGRPIGMVSKSDLVSEDYEWAEAREGLMPWQRVAGRSVAEDADLFTERDLASRTVADVMTSAALSVLPTATIPEACQLMIKHHVHRLPVIDEHRNMVGIVTTFDITRWVATGGRPSTRT